MNADKKALTGIIVGAGHRALSYAEHAVRHPEDLKIVGVADPLELRRKQTAEKFGFSPAQCYKSAEELAAKGKIADVIINGTMDNQHVPTSLPLLEAGYDILLEKPFAVHQEELKTLVEAARKHKRKIMICHVLRYAPFYRKIRELALSGRIGKILNMQCAEHISYHHIAVGYIRGKWHRDDICGSSILMAKSCHDLDIMMWMKSGINPVRVAGFGGLSYFNEANAPKASGTRCLVDCPIEKDCLYSAKKHYIDHPERWSFYVWHELEHIKNPTIEQKIEHLKKPGNPFGKCVWKCDNNVADHHSVVIEYADGATATFNLVGGASRPMRKIHLMGTEGEIDGIFEDSRFVIRHIDTRPGKEYTEEIVDLNISGDMTGAFGGHGGGDERLIQDFVNYIRGEAVSISCTSIEDSVNGHLTGFLAEKARKEGKVLNISL